MVLTDIWNWIQENGILAAVITGVIAILFNQRQKNIDRFYSQSDETLEVILEPMYYFLKEIKETENEDSKLELIADFFEKYNGRKGSLSKLRNLVLIDQIIETEECFEKYNKDKNEENKKQLLFKMRLLQGKVFKEYKSVFVSLNRNYNWYKIIFKTNYLLSVVFILIRWVKETLSFVVGASAFSLLVILHDKYLGEGIFKTWLGPNLYILTSSAIALYIFWLFHTLVLKDTMQRKDEISLVQEWLEKTKLGKWINENFWKKIEERIERRRERRNRRRT